MFTGIVLGQGKITSRHHKGSECELIVESSFDWDSPLVIGESIAVSGVCLTVTETVGARSFKAFASTETLRLTTIGQQNEVNLERALRLIDRLGGHLVSGHVDALTTLKNKTKEGNSLVCVFSLPQDLSPLVVPKGSVAIDGISLTVNQVKGDTFTVNIIPHTSKLTTLSNKSRGQTCNLEVDILGRHIKRLLETSTTNSSYNLGTDRGQAISLTKEPTQGITIEDLISQGF